MQFGCGGSSFHWVGRWRGNRNLKGQPGANPSVVYTVGMIDLILKANGTFELLDASEAKTGLYRLSGEKAFLDVKTVFNKPIADLGSVAVAMNKEIELSVKDNSTIVYYDPGGFEHRTFDLKRRDDL